MVGPSTRFLAFSGFLYRGNFKPTRQKLKVPPLGKSYPPGTITIACRWCRTTLFKYLHKPGGEERICYFSRILEDLTERNRRCPLCQNLFAVYLRINGKRAYKLRDRQTRILEFQHLKNIDLKLESES